MDRPTTDDERAAAVGSPEFFSVFGDPDPATRGDDNVAEMRDGDDAAWAAIHNAGRIDLLARCLDGADSAPWFAVHQTGCRLNRLLPALDCSVDQLAAFMASTQGTALADAVGADAVVRWLHARPVVVADIVAAPTDASLSVNLFTVALQAAGVTAKARGYLVHGDARIRFQAINALAWMPDDESGADETLKALELVSADLDDDERAGVLRVLFHLNGVHPETDIVPLLKRSLADGGATVQNQAVVGLTRTPSLLALAARDDIAEALIGSRESPSRFFSVLVRALAKGSHTGAAVLLAARLGEPEAIEALLGSLPGEQAMSVVIDWLGQDAERLGPGIERFFNGRRARISALVVVQPEAIPAEPRVRIFVAMKAMCWLLLEPVTVAAIIAAFLTVADGDDERALTQLLRTVVYDHAAARDHLARIKEKPGASVVIGPLLDEHEVYQHSLEAMITVAELRPTEAHRMTLRTIKERASQAMARDVHDQSSFLSLFPRSLVLHGAGVVYSVHDAVGGTMPATMKMATVSTSIALPTLSVLDPVGYDMLNVKNHRADLKQ